MAKKVNLNAIKTKGTVAKGAARANVKKDFAGISGDRTLSGVADTKAFKEKGKKSEADKSAERAAAADAKGSDFDISARKGAVRKTKAELAEIQASKDVEKKAAKEPRYRGMLPADSRSQLALRVQSENFSKSNAPRTQERARKAVGELLTSGIHAINPSDRQPCMTPGCKNTTGWDDSVTCKDCDSQGKF